MKTIMLPAKSGILKTLQNNKVQFYTYLTNNTTTIVLPAQSKNEEDIKYLITDGYLSKPDLGFIGQVKRHCEKLNTSCQRFTSKDISYFCLPDLRTGTYEGCKEVDLSAAYWDEAFRLGYISEKIYLKGLTVSKKTRLVALGAMACVKQEYFFDGEKYTYINSHSNESTRSYFFHIAYEIDQVMKKVFSKFDGDVLFYWVDAFFIREKIHDSVLFEIAEAGMKCKTLEVEKITSEKAGRYRKRVMTAYMKSGDVKKYMGGPGNASKAESIANFNRLVYEASLRDSYEASLKKAKEAYF